jgi:hypothetical protein
MSFGANEFIGYWDHRPNGPDRQHHESSLFENLAGDKSLVEIPATTHYSVVGQQHRVLFTDGVGHLLRYPLVLTGRNVASAIDLSTDDLR